MTFSIDYDKQPLRFFKKQDAHIVQRIMDKIDALLINNPVPHTAVAIVGRHGVYRIRIGDYRALYRVNHEIQKIIVFKIDKRSLVYD